MSATPVAQTTTVALETRSGLDPWVRADLPAPPAPEGARLGGRRRARRHRIGRLDWERRVSPRPRCLRTARAVAPLGDDGRGLASNRLQHRGDALHAGNRGAGVHRTRPSSTAWAWLYAALYFLQVGWPAWAGTAAAAIFFLFARRLAGPSDAAAIYYIGVGPFWHVWQCSRWGGASCAHSSCSTGF